MPSDQEVNTFSDFLNRLTVQFALIAHEGAIFTATILRYQYERDAYNTPDSEVPIPSQLVASYQILTLAFSQIRALVSDLKPKSNSSTTGLYELIGPEGRTAIKDAVHYVEFYVEPYKGAVTALMKSFWEVRQATQGHDEAHAIAVVDGHMKWLMEQEDGDV